MNYKEELIRRYEYLCENVNYVLGSYLRFQSRMEYLKDRIKGMKLRSPMIYLDLMDQNMIVLLEEFLFGDTVMENSSFYLLLEEKKKDSAFMKKIENSISLVSAYNEKQFFIFQIRINMWELLSQVRVCLEDSDIFVVDRYLKINALDEYFRICRYCNDGKIWTSGYSITCHDVKQLDEFYMVFNKPYRNYEVYIDQLDDDCFLSFLCNKNNKRKDNGSILSEAEKQKIYLKFHEDLCPLEVDQKQKRYVK